MLCFWHANSKLRFRCTYAVLLARKFKTTLPVYLCCTFGAQIQNYASGVLMLYFWRANSKLRFRCTYAVLLARQFKTTLPVYLCCTFGAQIQRCTYAVLL